MNVESDANRKSNINSPVAQRRQKQNAARGRETENVLKAMFAYSLVVFLRFLF